MDPHAGAVRSGAAYALRTHVTSHPRKGRSSTEGCSCLEGMALKELRSSGRAGQRRNMRRPFSSGGRTSGAVRVHAGKALIVNTKSGGHAFIGLYLARELLAKGHSVTILNEGDQVRCC